jgi:hypothetical protein
LTDEVDFEATVKISKRSKNRSKSTFIPSTQPIRTQILHPIPIKTEEPSPTSSLKTSSVNSSVQLPTNSAFKPFKPLNTIKNQQETKNKDNLQFNNLIVKRHLEDLLEKNNLTKLRNIRRTKSESNINRVEKIMNDHENKRNSHSMTNINISTNNTEAVKENQKKNNILFINKNIPKGENFLQRIHSSTTTSSSPTGTNSTIGMNINSGISKPNLSMLRFPCSVSFYDFTILTFRLKDTCTNLVKFLIPVGIERMSSKFFEAKFESFLCVYKVKFP